MESMFADNIAKIRQYVNSTDAAELQNNLEFTMVLELAAQRKGPSVLVYDPYDNGLPTREDVDCVLPPGEKTYIVAADMHY
jgi:hypothetical protein